MSAEPFTALDDAIEAVAAGRPDRASAAALIVLATESARIRRELAEVVEAVKRVAFALEARGGP